MLRIETVVPEILILTIALQLPWLPIQGKRILALGDLAARHSRFRGNDGRLQSRFN